MAAERFDPTSEQAIEAALERDDPVELTDLILELAIDGTDRGFAENCCVRLARHRNPNVRGNAVLGLGHLARRFGRLDGQRVKRVMEIALHERSEHVSAQARSAAEDLATFLNWEFDFPDA